jgi:hypothetical protein
MTSAMVPLLLLVLSALSALPLATAVGNCGNWQEKYTELHRRIVAGEAPQRFLVSIPPFTGLADKLVGLPAEVMWAMLTDRAFQYLPRHGFPPYDSVFDIDNINITGPVDLPNDIQDSPGIMDFGHYLDRLNSPDKRKEFTHNFHDYFPICLRNNDSANTIILAQSDLHIYPPTYYNAKYLMVESNRGMSYRFFENPYHAETLRSWGLNPDNSFGCIMNYLFRIKENGCDVTCQSIRKDMEVAKQQNTVVVGIQIRVGDASMEGKDTTTLGRGAPHFKCAQDIADQIKQDSGQKVIFYLISDSISLLTAAKQEYGDRLLADNTTRPLHTATANTHSQEGKIRMIQHTTNQVFLFSKADYHVVTTDSGFGMMAAWMNDKPIKGRVYRVSGNNPVCKGGESEYKDVVTDPRTLAMGWSGI